MSRIKTTNGAKVPSVGLGTWELSGELCTKAAAAALGIGYRHIDTAQLYQNEEAVGLGIRSSGIDRQAIFLTTKVLPSNLSSDRLIPSVEQSLRNLQTEYVDLLLIHWPTRRVSLETSLGLMERLREEGKVRHLGVSNFPPSLFQRALEIVPLVNLQVEYHPYLSQEVLLEMARTSDMIFTAYSPLAKGHVFGDRVLNEIAAAHNKTVAQVVLRWLIQQQSVVAIPRSANPEHIRSNFEIWDFELGQDEMGQISALARGQRIVNPSFMDWERTDEALWWRGRRIPAAGAKLIKATQRGKARLRRIMK